ncbi:MAG: hypothetical protein HZB33_07505 [Nitrospirae bacterium]|nr:hypothetical protein [Nitrospirota bacterium]
MTKDIEKALLTYSADKKIPCGSARKIAEDLKVPYSEVGKVADELGIRIKECELGCF